MSNFHLTGIYFRGELQHVGHVGEQKIKCGPIRTREMNDIRLLDKLYVCTQELWAIDCSLSYSLY